MAAPNTPVVTVTTEPEIGRNRIAVELDGTADELDVYRVAPSGIRAYVRGAVAVAVAGKTQTQVVDYEAPFGVAVTYYAAVRGERDPNLVDNPSLDADAAGWSTGGAGTVGSGRAVAAARSALYGFLLKASAAGAVWATTILRAGGLIPVVAGTTYTLSVYLRRGAAGARLAGLGVDYYNAVGAVVAGGSFRQATTATTADFVRRTYTTVAPAGAVTAFLYPAITNAGAIGDELHLDDLQFEVGAVATDFAGNATGPGEATSVGVVVTLDVDADWLVDLDDARNTGPVLVESFAELTYESPQGVHRVLGRRTPIVTSDLRWTPSGRLVLTTETAAEARRVRDALGSSSPLLFRSTFERGVGNMYVLPGTVVEQRISRIATAADRRWLVDLVEIDRPDPSLYVPKAVTWAEIVAAFPTWQDLLDARATWGDVLYDRTGLPDEALYSREPAFPPRDV